MKCPICNSELESKKSVKIAIGFRCLICGQFYFNYQDAEDCEKSHELMKECFEKSKENVK